MDVILFPYFYSMVQSLFVFPFFNVILAFLRDDRRMIVH